METIERCWTKSSKLISKINITNEFANKYLFAQSPQKLKHPDSAKYEYIRISFLNTHFSDGKQGSTHQWLSVANKV
jgi:hypothetical protein